MNYLDFVKSSHAFLKSSKYSFNFSNILIQ